MRKLVYLLVITVICAACTSEEGYVVPGTIEGGAEGDIVYLSFVEKGNFANIDSSVIKNGVFTFKGRQDTAVNRYVRSKEKVGNTNRKLYGDFFLENGEINIVITPTGSTVSGTPNNDAYQAIRNEMYELQKNLANVPKKEQMKEFDKIFTGVMKNAATRYISMPVGIHFLKQAQHFMETAELAALLERIPEDLANDPAIVRMKDLVKRKQATAVGCKFVDFIMTTPEGKTAKLSEYAGNGKVVLIDFWASWCAPCRSAIPRLIKIYEQYKDKGFEIVAVSLDQDAKAWKEAIGKMNMPWPQLSDLKAWKSEGVKSYAVATIPYTILIDSQGKIIARDLHEDELEKAIAESVK